MTILLFVVLGFAGGTTFTLLLLSGARATQTPPAPPRTTVSLCARPYDWQRRDQNVAS